MNERLKQYEGLVQATVRYWRIHITTDLADEDIAQELRLQIWKSLQAYDPVKAKGYSEEKFVFWHMRNKVKDLIAKKHREYFESPTAEMNVNEANRESSDIPGMGIAYRKEFEPSDRASTYVLMKEDGKGTDLISGLPRRQQEICVLMLQGYNNTEVAGLIGITTSTLRVEINKIKSELSVRLSASAAFA